jgi:hypothetical protein
MRKEKTQNLPRRQPPNKEVGFSFSISVFVYCQQEKKINNPSPTYTINAGLTVRARTHKHTVTHV